MKCVKLGWDLLSSETNSWKICYQSKLASIRNGSVEPVIESPTDNILDNLSDKMEKIDNDSKVGAKSNKITPKITPKPAPTVRNRSREKTKKKEPTIPPWRPSAGKPEDMYFEKFNRIMNQKRAAERRSRSVASGSKLKSPSTSLSSSQLNIKEYSDWVHHNHDRDQENNQERSEISSMQERTVKTINDIEKGFVEETTRRKITRNEIECETIDTLSQLQHVQHVPWNYTEMLSDEEYGS